MTEISIGRISGPFGLKGFAKIESSGDILPHIKTPIQLTLKHPASGAVASMELTLLEKKPKFYLAKFKEFSNPEVVEEYKGWVLIVPESDVPEIANENEFFGYQLIGLTPVSKVEIETGIPAPGDFKVTTLIDNPAHPIISFENKEIEILIPFLDQFIGDIDLKAKTIEVKNWRDWFAV